MEKLSLNLICILGHTAGGKTAFAAQLAYRFSGEIISADSRQVYKFMDIGTGKDRNDYIVNNKEIPGHLIDIVSPEEEYNVFEYQKDFLSSFHEITKRGNLPFLCGGTGMYIEAVLKGYKLIRVPVNPELRAQLSTWPHEKLVTKLQSYKILHNKTDTENRKRLERAIEIEEFYNLHPEYNTDYPELNYVIIGIKYDRKSRRERITARLKSRIENGMIEETEELLKMGIPTSKLEYFGLEYKYLAWYLDGKLSYDEMFEQLNTAIHQFAKRQMTWFRKMERSGFRINWLEGHLPLEQKLDQSIAIISKINP